MQLKKSVKSNIRKAGNILFWGLLLLLVFNPGAKAWMLRQLMAVGLFRAEIQKNKPEAIRSVNTTSFAYRDEDGNDFSTGSLKGRVVFINFWATWCPPCLAEMPSLNNLYTQLQDDKRFVFLFINEDEDIAKAKTYLVKHGYTMPLLTSTGNLPSELFSGTLPTTIILNKDGSVAMKHEGLANYNTQEFLNQLKELPGK